MTYTKDQLRQIFQKPFIIQEWQQMLQYYFHATELKEEPERINGTPDDEQGYYLGAIDTTDNYHIGLFYYKIQHGNVARKRVGLRHLVHQFVHHTTGEFDAALVAFEGDQLWRLSFICDIKGENTAPKRYTYVFGERDNFYNTPVGRFDALQRNGISFDNIKEAFSVEALNKDFYKDLFEWYQWAVDDSSNVTFPNSTVTKDDDRDDIEKKMIRMITRIMFVWFIKQKDLVPNRIFDINFLSTILKDFDPYSMTDGNYYNAILQNLFFATLNTERSEREFVRPSYHGRSESYGVKTLYRDNKKQSWFTFPEDKREEMIKALFDEVPYLNGGLFECLDKFDLNEDGKLVPITYHDGFSTKDTRLHGNYQYRAFVPNNLFFEPEKGLISILSRYNFTIEENSPEEQQVALDPELLGKVFENLLGAYNPETKETARNQSGSFYTPREIVNYMVDESLIAYLGDNTFVRSLFRNDFTFDKTKTEEYRKIADKLKAVKVLDPACGSGAFPMGLLNRMIDLLERISPEESIYDLKLSIIENCLYGSDIQSIAAQITKLRFFISLICDCEKDASKPNFGIPTLPNLETKFVTANSLIKLKRAEPVQLDAFDDTPRQIFNTKKDLADVRCGHFKAKTQKKKKDCRAKDQQLREKLTALLSNNKTLSIEDAKQLAAWNPYDQNAVSPFFDPEWMFGVADGFDIVIGNPPYIQLQNNGGELAKLYEHCGYSTFARTGDIYCLFYERGWQLLKKDGHLCYITSNKWMRAGYGEKTREFFANKTNPMLLIDFAGVKIFESATVDTNILLFAKSNNQHGTVCAVTNKQNKDSIKNLSDFVQQQNTISDFATSDSWVILSPIEQSIKKKIEAVGTPLKDWDINIYRGVLTGCNEAFIISSEKRDEILANCQTEDERKRTEELIRPILRGRDIKRYGYEWANLYLIATFPARHYNIDEYPAVKEYLLSFGIERLEQTGKTHKVNGESVKARKKTSNKWFETQDSISYWEDFNKPKIVWGEISDRSKFAYEHGGKYIPEATTFLMVGNHLPYLFCVLNSPLSEWFFSKVGTTTGVGTVRWKKYTIQQLLLPNITDKQQIKFDNDVELYIKGGLTKTDFAKEVNKEIYKSVGLSDAEIDYVENFYPPLT